MPEYITKERAMDCVLEAVRETAENLQDLYAIRRKIAKEPSGWISVNDRMPETNDEVLITYFYDNKPKNTFVEAASYFDDGEGEGHWSSAWDEYRIGNARRTVIAWMPMPKPYKPEVHDAEA